MIHSTNQFVVAALTVVLAWQLTSGLSTAINEPMTKSPAHQPSHCEDESLPDLPVGLTSFGGAVTDRHLYVFGGHIGAAHEYYQSGQNGTLYRLNLDQPKKWESVSASTGLQGLAMVAHQGKIYRIGGFEARNKQGEDQDLHSVAEFAVFDPDAGRWKQLNPMPVARSSFDAAVVGDMLYVVGGWTIAGDQPTQWCDTALTIDLSHPGSEWKEMPKPPFLRRAMSVSFQGNKLYVIGGMQQRGGPTRQVAVFDMDSQSWSDGPELPGDESMEGFGNSSFNVGDRLIASTYSGQVLRLNDTGDKWEQIHQLEAGRFFHRLLPLGDQSCVLVGGANMESGKAYELEIVQTR